MALVVSIVVACVSGVQMLVPPNATPDIGVEYCPTPGMKFVAIFNTTEPVNFLPTSNSGLWITIQTVDHDIFIESLT